MSRVNLIKVTACLFSLVSPSQAFGSYLLDEWRCSEPLYTPGAVMMGSDVIQAFDVGKVVPNDAGYSLVVLAEEDEEGYRSVKDRYEFVYDLVGPGSLRPALRNQQVGCGGKRVVGRRRPSKGGEAPGKDVEVVGGGGLLTAAWAEGHSTVRVTKAVAVEEEGVRPVPAPVPPAPAPVGVAAPTPHRSAAEKKMGVAPMAPPQREL